MKAKQDTPRRHHTPTQVPTTATASRIPRVRASSASDISFLQLCFADCVSRVRANRPGVHSAKQARVVSKAPSFPPRALLLARCDHPCAHVYKVCTTNSQTGAQQHTPPRGEWKGLPRGLLEAAHGGAGAEREIHSNGIAATPAPPPRAARERHEAEKKHYLTMYIYMVHGTYNVMYGASRITSYQNMKQH